MKKYFLIAARACAVSCFMIAGPVQSCDIPEVTQSLQSDEQVNVQQIFVWRWLDYLYLHAITRAHSRGPLMLWSCGLPQFNPA